jgi:ABC-type Fe3+-siderophore transport system permease subunit
MQVSLFLCNDAAAQELFRNALGQPEALIPAALAGLAVALWAIFAPFRSERKTKTPPPDIHGHN